MLTKTIAAGLVALTTLSAVPANAASFSIEFGGGRGWGHHDSYGYGNDYGHRRESRRLSTDEVRFMLRNDGYYAIRFFDDHGPIYQLRASKRGRDFVLVVNARSGEILSRQRI